MKNFGILGLGAWGTALGEHLARSGCSVLGWNRGRAKVEALKKTRLNADYFSEPLSPKWSFTTDLKAVLAQDIVLCAIPSKYIQSLDLELQGVRPKIILSATKGVIAESLTPCSFFSEKFPETDFAVLSGPSFASDVFTDKPIGMVCAASNAALADELANIFTARFVRVYSSTDIVGVEWGGILKNVVALAAGMADGLELGDSARAALITRGLKEVTGFAVSLGAQSSTLGGLSGLGDLLMTSTCDQSRNRSFGLMLGRGLSLSEANRRGLTAEGVRTLEMICSRPDFNAESMPIFAALMAVFTEKISPSEAVHSLLNRPVKSEF